MARQLLPALVLAAVCGCGQGDAPAPKGAAPGADQPVAGDLSQATLVSFNLPRMT